MATAATPEKQSGGDGEAMASASVGENETAQLRMSDEKLWERVQRLQKLLAMEPFIAQLTDGGKKLRLLVKAHLEELRNRRQEKAHQQQRSFRKQCNASLPISTSSLGQTNKQADDSTVDTVSKARVGDERLQRSEAEVPQSSSDKEALWERVQRLQVQFTGPNGANKLLFFLQACFREVNNRCHGAHPPHNYNLPDNVACEICGCSTPRPIAKCVECNCASPVSVTSGGAKRRRGPVNLYEIID